MSKTSIRPMIDIALLATIAYIPGSSYSANIPRPLDFPFL